jgi:O-acetylhomoserine (thiol)-lyase
LVVDNTVATPILLRPFEYGADVVVHSMTKFMGGHGTSLGGMIVDSGKFPWRQYPKKFYMFNVPEIAYHGVVYVDHFGEAAYVARCRTVCQRNTGATLSPFNGFLLLQGVETMALRVERHVENARKVAEFLRDHSAVAWVNYAGFPDSPLYPMAQRYLGSNRCSLLTFGVKGGFEAGRKCFDGFKLFKRMVNMGDAKSLSCHPASTTHRQLTPEEQAKVGVTPEMIRLSVGIEHIDDILADLSQALDKAKLDQAKLEQEKLTVEVSHGAAN